VYPEQPDSLVEAFAKRIKIDLDSHFVVQTASLKSSIRPPAWSRKPVPVRQYLSQVCDLAAAPTRKQLEILAALAKDPAEAERLRDLSSTFESSIKKYDETVIQPSLTIVDALNTIAKSVDLSFAAAIEILSATKPRFYSISSSPVVHPDRIHITVGVKEWDAAGKSRHGLCSTFLASLKPGDRVYASIKSCPSFRLPKQLSTPVICIGAGTGVAPFRGFLQERSHLHETGSINLLVFGCRNDQDYIYKEEWQALQDAGKARVETAFSRPDTESSSASKEYVQDRLKRVGSEIFKLLDGQNASVFVCGDGRFMAKDVSKALHDVAMKHGGMTELEAQTFVSELQASGRYVQDVWG
jgi:cytochrome P450 / NADPH-cytochrome P450 reductase